MNLIRQTLTVVASLWIVASCTRLTYYENDLENPFTLTQDSVRRNRIERRVESPTQRTCQDLRLILLVQVRGIDTIYYKRYSSWGYTEWELEEPSSILTMIPQKTLKSFGCTTNTVGNTLDGEVAEYKR